MNRIFFVAMVAATLLTVGTAWAHAFLDHARPVVGATVAAPREVAIWFTEEVEPAFSRIAVTNAAGARVDKNDTHIDQADAKVLHVSLNSLPPGTYKVSWQVVSVDTHRTQGDFSFTVEP